MRTANYRIVESLPDCMVIRDVGPWDQHPTVTNDAEQVVSSLAFQLADRRLYYFDSEGELGELKVKGGKFVGFAPFDGAIKFKQLPSVPEPTFRDSNEAFRDAIKQGRLVNDSLSPLYAGNYMYMGTYDGVDAFKHVVTRQYLPTNPA